MKGIITTTLNSVLERGKSVLVAKRFLKIKHNINVSLKVLNQRIKNKCK